MDGRVIRPEKLERLGPREAKGNLRDLVRLNRWLGGHRILSRLLGEFYGRREAFTLLDVGAASGDFGRAIGRRFPRAVVTSLDLRLHHLDGASTPRLVADAWRLPFPRQAFDVVFCSLLLHHFPNPEAADLLRRLAGIARRALIVLDLERHRLPYWFLPLTRQLFRWDPVTVHDGCLSVAAGFQTEELARLARDAGLEGAVVRRHRPWFRMSLVSRFSEEP